jgi:hypothetical protein
MVESVAVVVAVFALGLWTFHRIGAVLDARMAKKELGERVARLDQLIENTSATKARRVRQLVDRERPIGRLLTAVRDEPTVPLR